MKKLIIVFCILSLVAVFFTEIYFWITLRDEALTLSYVPDQDWSQWREISPTVADGETIYDSAMDSVGNLHVFWNAVNRKKGQNEILHTVTDSTGKVLTDAQVLIANQRLADFGVTMIEDEIHIFWMGNGESVHKFNLFYSRFDLQGEKRGETTVLTELTENYNSVKELKAAGTGQGFFLAWTDKTVKPLRVYGLRLDADGKPLGMIEDYTLTRTASKPAVVADELGQYHFVWLEQVYAPERDSKYYSNLMYLCFDQQGQRLSEPQKIAEISDNQVSLQAYQRTLYMAWTGILSVETPKPAASTAILEDLLPNYVLYGTKIDVHNPAGGRSIVQLTPDVGPAFNQAMAVDAEGRVHLVYSAKYRDDLAWTHQVWSADWQELKAAKRLFPNRKVFLNMAFLQLKYPLRVHGDPVQGIHLLWMYDHANTIHRFAYANTLYPSSISPLQVVGFDRDRYGSSLMVCLLYVLLMPWLNIIIYAEFFSLVILTALFAWLVYLLRKVNWERPLDNPYVAGGVILFAHVMVMSWFKSPGVFFRPNVLLTNELWFTLILTLLTALTFLFLVGNKIKNKVILGGITALFVVYWLNMIALCFMIPDVVFYGVFF